LLKTKAVALLMAVAVSIGSVSSINTNTIKNFGKSLALSSSEELTPVDLAIANDEKIIEMLKKKGTIPKNATPEQASKILKDYLKDIEKKNDTSSQKLKQMEQAGIKKFSQEASKKSTSKNAQSVSANAESSGNITKGKALVILVQFPDLMHNSIKPGETDMYYQDYTPGHFSNMLFGTDGYAGPNGEKLISMKQYYDEQSGKTYDFSGSVVGWYTASHPAAYYGAHTASGGNDSNPRALVKEALLALVKDKGEDFLKQFDLENPYGIVAGGKNQPDGIIDHLMIIHSGIGEEAGGGALGDNAIWSHSSKVYSVSNGAAVPWNITGTKMYAYPYTIEPEDGAAGVFSHEYGHDLGLPDEYDINYTGAGEPVAYWSIMSAGSWSGKVPGTEPSGFSPWCKQYFQNTYGGNWFHGTTVDYKDITEKGASYVLDQASVKGKNNDFVRVNLPDKATTINTPAEGKYEYFSGKGDNLDNSMVIPGVDLTNASTSQLSFKTWYDIEPDFDYASIQVKAEGESKWTSVKGNITTDKNPNEQNPGNGITGKSNGWVDASFDLSDYKGKKVDIKIDYWTDAGATYPGFYVDDIKLSTNNGVAFADNAEGDAKLTLNGFKKDDGKMYTKQYYLVEWRSHAGVDAALGDIKRGNSLMSYDPGMLIWYADDFFSDNCTGPVSAGGHPGDGFVGIVDADQTINKWSDGTVATTRYQLNDAAFSLKKGSNMFLDYVTRTLTDNKTFMHPIFDDQKHYMNSELPDAGRNIPKLGLKIYVTAQSKDMSTGTIMIKK
jgi:immune inhibitor A